MAKKKGIIADYNQIEQVIWQLVESPIADCGGELIDVEFVKEAGSRYLRIYVDRENIAVDHQLCESVSNRISDLLDEADPISESYYLEVSSPGLERRLKRQKDFLRFSGQNIAVHLYAAEDGIKDYYGVLVGLQDDNIVIHTPQGEKRFPLDKVSKANLTVEF